MLNALCSVCLARPEGAQTRLAPPLRQLLNASAC